MSDSRIALFRLATSWPPADQDYRSLLDKGKPIRPPVTDEKVAAWSGLSCFESAKGAREVAEQFPGRWRYIVRYDVPVGGPIAWRPTFGSGHVTVWATQPELEPYLALDYHESV